jgi:hypothetical protein
MVSFSKKPEFPQYTIRVAIVKIATSKYLYEWELNMNRLKVTAIASFVTLSFIATSAFAEVPAAPSSINPNDHVALANYYEGLVKEVSAKLETNQQKLNDYEDHPYYYGRQGQDLRSHLQANIREYKKELVEDLQEAKLHRKIAASEQGRQFSKAEANVGDVAVQ